MKRVGIDVGGTFTDVVSVEDGEIVSYKTPSTPSNSAIGVSNGLDLFTADNQDTLDYIHHGTTVGTNALLEGNTAPTALITTEGFRDVLEIGRQDRPELYNLGFTRPSPVVPRNLRFTVKERVGPDGDVIIPLDIDSLEKAIGEIPDSVEAVAVSTLFSFANPKHEKLIEKYLVENGFTDITLSSEVLPEIREYERTSTTVINASLKPVFRDYLGQLEDRARRIGVTGTWLVMQSNGGLIEPEVARNQPLRTILSGPAGGVKGSQFIGSSAGFEDLLTLDMGGTSADVCLIKSGEAAVTTDWEINGHRVGVSSLDVHTIGSGGGSIAWIDEGGALRVGPKSAGADPGPACYGKGGKEPTVTDAHLVLGRLDQDFPLADSLKLNREASKNAVNEKMARPLGLTTTEAAQGILDVANSNMKRALRLVSVQQGYDPRTFTLLAYGGAGPLHATQLAAEMSIPRVIIPPAAGVLSALGLLVSNTRQEFVSSVLEQFNAVDPGDLVERWKELGKEWGSGSEDKPVDLKAYLDMRYVGQSYHLRVPVSQIAMDGESLSRARDRFHDLHKRKYGYAKPKEPVEIVNQRLDVIGQIEKVMLSCERERGDRDAFLGKRNVVFPEGEMETDVYRYESLGLDESIDGPAIVHSRDSTITVMPGQKARLTRDGALIIEV